MVMYGPVWFHMVPYGPIWSLMVPYGPVRSCLVPYDTVGPNSFPYTTYVSFCSTHVTSAQILWLFSYASDNLLASATGSGTHSSRYLILMLKTVHGERLFSMREQRELHMHFSARLASSTLMFLSLAKSYTWIFVLDKAVHCSFTHGFLSLLRQCPTQNLSLDYQQKLTGMPKNLRVHPFPDPVGQIGVP